MAKRSLVLAMNPLLCEQKQFPSGLKSGKNQPVFLCSGKGASAYRGGPGK
jgi:hypothetical protein